MTDVMNTICFFRLGMVDQKADATCKEDACSLKYEATAFYSNKTAYITPQFKVAFSDHIPHSDTTPSPVYTKKEWPSSESGMRVSVEAKFAMDSLPAANEALLSECVEKVGKSILDRFRLYDVGSILPRLPKDRQNDYTLSENTLRDLDLSILQIWIPK